MEQQGHTRISFTTLRRAKQQGCVGVDIKDPSRVFINSPRTMSLSRDEAINYATAIVNAVDQLEGSTND